MASGLSFAPAAAFANDTSASTGVAEIVVTGTRSATATAQNATAPIDVVKGETLTKTGAADLSTALQMALPSVNFPQVTIGSAAGANLNATLRGLAPDQVLILINGQRQHKSAFVNVKPGSARGTESVDLSTIPLSAIDHVEVLRDAAAAQYGSDAIAGVINIVLKGQPDGGSVSIRSGQWQDGDGFTTYGHAWKGFALPNNGYATIALDAGMANDTNQFTSPETRKYYFPGDPRELTVNKEEFYRGQPQVRTDIRLAATAEEPITDDLKFKTFFDWADKLTRIDGNPLLPNANETLRAFYPNGVRPNQFVYSLDTTVGASLDYDAKAFGKFDLSFNYGSNKESFKTTSSDNASLGLASPTAFYTGALYTNQYEADLGWVKEVPVFKFPEPLTLSAGVSWRREMFEIEAGDPTSYEDGHVPILDGPNAGKVAPFGSMTWQAYLPSDAGIWSRDVWGAYVGVEGNPTDKLKFSLNGRGEHYSDFGDVGTGEFSSRYDFAHFFALRGSVSTGVRAPSLGQSHYSYIQTTTLTNNTALFEIKTFPVDSPTAIALGGAPLKPEKSVNLSGGGVFRFGHNGSLSVDVYQITIHDRIALSDNFSGPAVQQLLDEAGYPQAVGANFFTNALDTRTRGLSISGLYPFDLGDYGKFTTNFGAEFNHTDVTQIREVNGKTPIGRQTAGYLEYGTPDKKIILGGDWTRNRWEFNVTGIFYGHYKQLDAINPALDQTFHNQFVVNTFVDYALTSKVKLSIGADNLFDSTPDPILSWRTAGGLPSSPLNPVSWDGRFVWGQATYDF